MILLPIVISNIGALSIFFTVMNKDKNINKLIIIFNIINILYLFIISIVINYFLPIIIDLGIFLTLFISIIGGVLYLISTIICICKRKRLNKNLKNKLIIKVFIIIVLTPIIIFNFVLCKEVMLINNSEVILEFHSLGNGGFGMGHDFTYVISDKSCKEISVDVGLSYGYYNKMLLPKKLKKITKYELQNKGYKIVIENNYINVYKNQKLIHKEKLNVNYYNISLEQVFYNKQ